MSDPPSDNGKLSFPEGRPRVIFGPGVADRIGELARGFGARRALLVTDPHIVEAGHAPRLQRSLEKAGLGVTLYADARENPTTEDVDDCVEAARAGAVDLIVGLGGGSAMDTAKGCNFILTNGGRMRDYHGHGKASRPMLPLIAVPTTAGTGSECQSFALIADAQTHRKMACGDPKAAPTLSILDPSLTVSQPAIVTANTGVDALTHAVETAVTARRNELSLRYAREAFKLINENLQAVIEAPGDVGARGRMLLAAAYAGTAIEHSMLGAAHAAANPLTAHFGVIHSQAVGVMLPAVIHFNAEDPTAAQLYAALAVHAGLVKEDIPPDQAVAALLDRIEHLLTASGLPRRLNDLNIPRDAYPTLAKEAADQWTAGFNPRPIDAAGFASLYERAGSGAGVGASERSRL